MIVTESIPYKEITKHLKKSDKIGVISCNGCCRLCRTGGEKKLKEIASKLKKDGYTVVDMDLIGTPCDKNQLNKSQLHGNVQVVLSCEAGVYNLKNIFPKHKIICGTKTLGIGVHDGEKVTLVKETC